MQNRSFKQITQIALPLVLSLSINYMLGYQLKIDRTLIMLFFIYFLIDTKHGKTIIYSLCLLAAMYYPIAWYYGHPNLTIISALFETNLQESVEFLYDIPLSAVVLSVLYLLSTYIILFKIRPEHRFKNKKRILFLFSLICLWKPLNLYASGKNTNIIYELRFTPLEFIADFHHSYFSYLNESNKIKKIANKAPDWNISSSQQKYDNYILVIGESVRKDYLNSYGFKQENTPFMSTSPGIVWDGLISPGPNTYTSVVRLLALNNGIDVELNKNIISLANQSGMETYWLSNQGRMGDFDTIISAMAHYSGDIFFSKKGGYKDIVLPDETLLPHLKKVLSKKTQSSKLIVLHLMGSHQNFCQRVNNHVKFDYVNKKISCYITSIYNTDKLLKNIRDIASSSNESFSMVYLADHGLGHPNDKKSNLKHNPSVKQAYEVPLFITSSDDREHSYIKRNRSGLNFINFLSQWIGVNAIQLENNYNFYHPEDDFDIKVNAGNGKLVQYSTLKDDPV